MKPKAPHNPLDSEAPDWVMLRCLGLCRITLFIFPQQRELWGLQPKYGLGQIGARPGRVPVPGQNLVFNARPGMDNPSTALSACLGTIM